jgi:TonB family protein
MRPFLATSVVLHGGLFALIAFGHYLLPSLNRNSWGSSTAKQGLAVGMVDKLPGIPLPSPPVVQENAKANESNTLHPAEPLPKAPKSKTKAPDKPAEVKIPERGAKPSKEQASPAKATKEATPPPPPDSNALPGAGGQAALPYGQAGTGAASIGGDGNFGSRFPEYVTNMNRAVSSQWNFASAMAGNASKRVLLVFTISRSGASAVASGIRVEESSGSVQLDNSAQRAVMAAKLPPLPREYTGSSVEVRFYFESKH